jgi:hypothetical protein
MVKGNRKEVNWLPIAQVFSPLPTPQLLSAKRRDTNAPKFCVCPAPQKTGRETPAAFVNPNNPTTE